MGGVLFFVSRTFEENDPHAVLMVCKTGTVGANIIQLFNCALDFVVFIISKFIVWIRICWLFELPD